MYSKSCPVCRKAFETRQHNQFICSKECKIKWNFILAVKRCEERVNEDMETYLKREYGVNQRSYRSLMKDLGCTNRTITKMLEQFGIEVRRGSEAVKSQWINNDERKKQQGKLFGQTNTGRKSHRMVSDETINKRLNKRNLQLIKRWVDDGYTYFLYKCMECGYTNQGNLKTIKHCCCLDCGTVSRGEAIIKQWLKERGYNYKVQFKIDDCKNILPLPFDIAVFNSLHELCYLIEYDGIQHFKPVERFGGESAFKEVKKRDKIKDNYCKRNNIRLIRIPYFQFDNIEKILSKKIVVQETLQV